MIRRGVAGDKALMQIRLSVPAVASMLSASYFPTVKVVERMGLLL
jgi:hypothetical protein